MRIHLRHLQFFRNPSQVAYAMTIVMQVSSPNILTGQRKPCCAFCDNPIHPDFIPIHHDLFRTAARQIRR
ncbi:MAG: hypothetical protein ACP5MD_07400, partial [Verrucomicrobiia bacterium]